MFHLESICVPKEELEETQTTICIGKHVPVQVSVSSTLINEIKSFYYEDPQNLMVGFVSNLELLAEISKLRMRTKLQDIEVAVNERMKKAFDQLNE